jgi:hypothetical protein
MTPTQSLEPSEIAVRSDQFTAMVDGQRRQISIGDQRPLDRAAQLHKDIPVSATWYDEGGSWPFDQPAAKYQGCSHRRRQPKDLGICNDSQEAGEHDLRDRERFRRLDQSFEPSPVSIVLRRVLPMRVNQALMSGSCIGLALPPKALDVVGFEQRSGLINIKRCELTALAERHQMETVSPLRPRGLQQEPHHARSTG